jgi:hypothetical protein
VVGVHMATPRLVSATPWNHIRLQPLNPFRNGLLLYVKVKTAYRSRTYGGPAPDLEQPTMNGVCGYT